MVGLKYNIEKMIERYWRGNQRLRWVNEDKGMRKQSIKLIEI
jgi:hypothetical protein